MPQVQSQVRQTFFPLLLMLGSPIFVFLFYFTNVPLEGSIVKLGELISQEGFWKVIQRAIEPYIFGSPIAWTMLAIFAVIQLLFMRFLPGKTVEGPITPAGSIPKYKANGPLAYGLTLFLFCFFSFYLKLFSPTIIYDHFPELLGALNIFSLCFCTFLLIKGYWFPSSKDSGSSGNLIFDYYWGTELYPRFFGWDVKQFTNCRFGMMVWPLCLISFAATQLALYGHLSDSMSVSVILQLVYITKFFFWETGYLRSLDIMHDRAGYYICWGCLVWLPGIYTSQALYLVNHPVHLGILLSTVILTIGLVSIAINYLADLQRQVVRKKGTECLVWGKAPKLILARYETHQGEKKENVLLASGWWGLSRHFHYIPELIASFTWTVPALFHHFLPYFYIVYLTILLTERAFRDDKRCAEKYNQDWDSYCKQVPYKIVPYVI